MHIHCELLEIQMKTKINGVPILLLSTDRDEITLTCLLPKSDWFFVYMFQS